MTDVSTDTTAMSDVNAIIAKAVAEEDFNTLSNYSESELEAALAKTERTPALEETAEAEAAEIGIPPTSEKVDDEGDKVPVKALVVERQQKRALAEENAYLKGRLDALEPKEPEVKPDDELARVHAQRMKLASDHEASVIAVAEQFDNGEITLAEAERKKAELAKSSKAADQELLQKGKEIFAAMNQPTEAQIASAWKKAESLPNVVEASAKMDVANPWFGQLTQFARDTVAEKAAERLEKEGIVLQPTADDVIYYRQLVLAIAKELGLAPVASSPAKTGTTVDDRKAALLRAAGQPPALGGVSAPSSLQDLSTMSDDDLSNLSSKELEELQRLYGI